ncbi:MAG: carotenoid oxygenase family protein, partial [Myxococcota bacterium]
MPPSSPSVPATATPPTTSDPTAPTRRPSAATAAAVRSSTSPAWAPALSDLTREHDFADLDVDGVIPDELTGTVLRNGPGLFSSHGQRYDHWFDGDGAVSAVRFAGGRARGAVRVVESRALVEERAAGRMLYGGYATIQPGLLRRLRGVVKNAANTSLMVWNDRLLALHEGSRPTELSLDDLSTIGETSLDGAVVRTFSAHPHYVPTRRAFYNIGVRAGRKTMLDIFELPDGGTARRMTSLPLPGLTMVHDFIATADHLIIFVPPLRVALLPVLFGRAGFSDALTWRPELGTEIIVVPIDRPDRVRRLSTEPFFTFHFANAFERDGALVVDFIRYPDFTINQRLSELTHGRDKSDPRAVGTLHRAIIDPRAPISAAVDMVELCSDPCEFPRVAPAATSARYRYCYLAGHRDSSGVHGLQDALLKIDLGSGAAGAEASAAIGDRWDCPPGHFTSEPIF